jgi:hypothetical protein
MRCDGQKHYVWLSWPFHLPYCLPSQRACSLTRGLKRDVMRLGGMRRRIDPMIKETQGQIIRSVLVDPVIVAVIKKLFFPDWDFLFNTIHRVGTSFERFVPMWRCHRDDNTAFSDSKSTETVYHGNFANGEFLAYFLPDLGHLFLCHSGICFVFECMYGTATKIVPHNTVKGNHGTVCGTFNEVVDGLNI